MALPKVKQEIHSNNSDWPPGARKLSFLLECVNLLWYHNQVSVNDIHTAAKCQPWRKRKKYLPCCSRVHYSLFWQDWREQFSLIPRYFNYFCSTNTFLLFSASLSMVKRKDGCPGLYRPWRCFALPMNLKPVSLQAQFFSLQLKHCILLSSSPVILLAITLSWVLNVLSLVLNMRSLFTPTDYWHCK